jgi:hypothetical protein
MPIIFDGTLGITTPMYNGSIAANAVTPSVSMKNRVINGDMRIDQRNAGASFTPANGQYCLDRWKCGLNNALAASEYTVIQSSTAPAGFSNSLLITSAAAHTVQADDYSTINYSIEGFNFADFGWGTANAKTITLSFQIRCSLTGTFAGWIQNANVDRSYPFTFTINAANTFESKSVTIPGDTIGTWVGATNGVGALFGFNLGTGSNRHGTANSWNASNARSVSGAVNLIATNGATMYITGVQLEAGSTATSFDYRPYGTELALCQRYFQINKRIVALCADATSVNGNLIYYCPMRTSPALGQQGVLQINDNAVNATQSSVSITFLNGDGEGCFVQINNFTGLTANRLATLRLNANTNGITLSAEL